MNSLIKKENNICPICGLFRLKKVSWDNYITCENCNTIGRPYQDSKEFYEIQTDHSINAYLLRE